MREAAPVTSAVRFVKSPSSAIPLLLAYPPIVRPQTGRPAFEDSEAGVATRG
jgi:hypothetical protein